MIFEKTEKRPVIFILLTVISICVLCGCVAYRYVTPYNTYNHEQHENALLARDMDCFSCHVVDVDERDPLKRLQKLKEMLKEDNHKKFDTKLCHQCHIDEKTKQEEAPTRCRLCHENLNEILPSDHQGFWKNTHAVAAQVSDAKCLECHDRWYCADCHTARDMSRARMHPRAFRIAHVAAASVDPASCSSCHSSAFCRDCHTR